MSIANESLGAKGPLAAPLADGVQQIAQNQEITFTKYARSINPLDGTAFWINAEITDPPIAQPWTTTRKGSLHYATDQVQREDETFGLNKVVFTSLAQIDEFNEIEPGIMWLGEFQGLRFSFNRRGMFYQQADLHHYVGDAVYPAMESQIIDDEDDIDAALVVSNSLPMWLTLDDIMPVYPSYLVGENIAPPYASIHIDPAGTTSMQTAPYLDQTMSHWQLASDRVRVTIYGLRNAEALDYLDYVLSFMRDGDTMGLQNMPIVRDEKRTQSELTVLAMKKSIEFQVSYYQETAREIARKFILSCTPTITFEA